MAGSDRVPLPVFDPLGTAESLSRSTDNGPVFFDPVRTAVLGPVEIQPDRGPRRANLKEQRREIEEFEDRDEQVDNVRGTEETVL